MTTHEIEQLREDFYEHFKYSYRFHEIERLWELALIIINDGFPYNDYKLSEIQTVTEFLEI